MDRIIAAIKERIAECKNRGVEFEMPEAEGCVVKRCEGSTSRHSILVLELRDGRTIRIDCRSKDRSDACHYERERSFVKVECSDHSNDFSDSWEENV